MVIVPIFLAKFKFSNEKRMPSDKVLKVQIKTGPFWNTLDPIQNILKFNKKQKTHHSWIVLLEAS